MVNSIKHPKWRSIFKENIVVDGQNARWLCNMKEINFEMKKVINELATWRPTYGLFPGKALCIMSRYSKWLHMSTNTLPFKYVIPKIIFNESLLMHGYDESEMSNAMTIDHWLHEYPQEDIWYLGKSISRWLKYHDGTHPLVTDAIELQRRTIFTR